MTDDVYIHHKIIELSDKYTSDFPYEEKSITERLYALELYLNAQEMIIKDSKMLTSKILELAPNIDAETVKKLWKEIDIEREREEDVKEP